MTSSASDDDNPLEELVEEFLERQRGGEHPALSVSMSPAIPNWPTRSATFSPCWPWSSGSSRRHLNWRACRRPIAADSGRRGADWVTIASCGTIGGGGMGMVYEAERESLKCRVALKVMHPEFRSSASYLRRFHTEARLAAGLHHTNIVSVFDFGEHGGVCYYAMQYIDGHGLDAVLDDVRRLRRAKGGAGFTPAGQRGKFSR